MIQRDGSILIDNWQKGVAPSPQLGFSKLVNFDIDFMPGVLRLNPATVKRSGSVVGATPQWFVKTPTSATEIFALDSSGVVYQSTNTGTSWTNISAISFTVTIASPAIFTSTAHGLVLNDTVVFSTTGALPSGLTAGTTYHVIAAGLTADDFEVSATQGGAAINTSGTQSGVHTFKGAASTHGNGLAIFEDYLIVARDATLDTYGPLSSTPAWNYNWQTIDSDALWHPMIVSALDGKLYGGAANRIFTIEELTTFAPGTSTTYTWTQQALSIPTTKRVKCLAELGNNLMIGTWQGSNSPGDFKSATIFPWDGSSPEYGQPIELAEGGVNAMLTVNNTLYLLAGMTGNIYECNGYSVAKIGQIPASVQNFYSSGQFQTYPGALTHHRGKLFFGHGDGGDSNGVVGVYSIDLATKAFTVEHLISTGNDGSSTTVEIRALLSLGYFSILIGWNSNSTYGIDAVTGYYTSGYAESELFQVGTASVERSYSKIECHFLKPLVSGDGITIKYRNDLSDSWTTWRSFVYSGTETTTTKVVGSKASFFSDQSPIGLNDFLQFQVTLVSGGSSTSELVSVRIS